MRVLLLLCAALAVVEPFAVDRPRRNAHYDDDDKCYCHFNFAHFWRQDDHHSDRGDQWRERFKRDPVLMAGRLDGNEARLEELESRFDKVKSRLKRGAERIPEIKMKFKDVEHRIEKLEGSPCREDQFSCGDDNRNCVGKVVVCDGDNDCPNGRDEDADTCRIIAHPGSIFEGRIVERETCTRRRPDKIRFVVMNARTNSWFTAFPRVTVSFLVTFHDREAEQTDTLSAEGFWDYKNRRLMVDAPESDMLGFSCDFDGVNDDHCHAAIIRTTGEECVSWHMYRVHHDDDPHDDDDHHDDDSHESDSYESDSHESDSHESESHESDSHDEDHDKGYDYDKHQSVGYRH